MDVAHLAGRKARVCFGDVPGSSLLQGQRGALLAQPGHRSVRSLPVVPRTDGRLAGKCQPLLSQPQWVRAPGEAKFHQSKQLLRILSFETKNRPYK